MTITLPAYTPSSWELRLPDYPIITNTWRSSSFPEILGNLPNGAEWRLKFENMDDAEALALLLPWRATGGGQWPLATLPAALAGGVDNVNFAKRLTGTPWAIAREPQKESVKKGRFNIAIDLVYELTFTSVFNLVLSVPAVGIRVDAPALSVNALAGVGVPSAELTISALAPRYIEELMLLPSAALSIAVLPPDVLNVFTGVAVPSANIAIAAQALAVATGASIASPAVDIGLGAQPPDVGQA